MFNTSNLWDLPTVPAFHLSPESLTTLHASYIRRAIKSDESSARFRRPPYVEASGRFAVSSSEALQEAATLTHHLTFHLSANI